MELADGNAQSPVVTFDVVQTIYGQVDEFADAEASGAQEEQRIRQQIVGGAEVLLQERVIFWRQRSGQSKIGTRNVFGAQQAGAVQIFQKTAQAK
jgi:hypothetical protein